MTFYSCTTNACGTKTSLGTGTLSSGKATLATSSLPVGHHLRRGRLRGLGQLRRFDLQRGVPGGQRARHRPRVLTSSPNPSSYGSSVTFTDTVSASSGTPGGTVTFYSCTTNACGTKTSLGTGTPQLGQGHLGHLEPAGGHHLRRGGLRGLGQLQRLHLERRGPGGQRPRDHLGPHLVAQPVGLRLLGDLHRHGLRLLGHAGRLA